MKRFLTTALPTAIIWMLPCSIALAKPSPAVKQILDKTVRDVKRNLQDFQKANKEPLSDARKDLQDLAKKLVDDRKEDEAKKVLEQIATLEADVMREANAPPMVIQPPQKPLGERLVGKWDRIGHIEYLKVQPDGQVALHRDDDDRVTVAGRFSLASPDIAEIAWDNGFQWQIRIAGDDAIAVFELAPKGGRRQGFALERVR